MPRQPSPQQHHHHRNVMNVTNSSPLAPPASVITQSQPSPSPSPQPMPLHHPSQSSPSSKNNNPRRIRLTPEARAALTKAVLSAIHSPTGSIDE
eukprot:8748145-Ditylum_brightwellii.AAC.1